jgi:hypothetical protein
MRKVRGLFTKRREVAEVKKKKIYIAIPAYDNKIFVMGMLSIFNNIEYLRKRGYDITFSAELGNCYIDLTRNRLVRNFLETDFTDMVFIDTDLAFDEDAIYKLVQHDTQMVGGAYPYRNPANKGFPIDIKLDKDKFPVTNFDLKLIECEHIPTGLLRIRRDVFDVLKEKYPENIDEKGDPFHFRTGLLFAEKGDHKFYGEDVYFSKICNEAGIKVYCDPTITFAHIGEIPVHGRFAEFLKNGGNNDRSRAN